MLLCKVESTHRPILIALEGRYGVSITVCHSVPDVTFKQVKQFKELLSNLVSHCLLILLILVSHLLKARVSISFHLLRQVVGLFLTDRSIEVNVFLLECLHGVQYLGHQLGRAV